MLILTLSVGITSFTQMAQCSVIFALPSGATLLYSSTFAPQNPENDNNVIFCYKDPTISVIPPALIDTSSGTINGCYIDNANVSKVIITLMETLPGNCNFIKVNFVLNGTWYQWKSSIKDGDVTAVSTTSATCIQMGPAPQQSIQGAQSPTQYTVINQTGYDVTAGGSIIKNGKTAHCTMKFNTSLLSTTFAFSLNVNGSTLNKSIVFPQNNPPVSNSTLKLNAISQQSVPYTLSNISNTTILSGRI